jgi:hypothetical protein
MKNLHLIETDKPSKLWKFNNEFYYVIDGIYGIFNSNKEKYNLYITSDEEIKEGDYRLNIQRDYFKKSDKEGLDYYNKRNDIFKKIILTTDQDLIKDGIQPIDDTFLEWFVKNPSCEFIQTERLEDGQYFDYLEDNSVIEGIYENYKIIIPQEEPKNTCPKCRTTDFDDCHSIKCPMRKEEPIRNYELIGECKGNPNGCFMDSCGHDCGCFTKEPKQETLEEVAEKTYQKGLKDDLSLSFHDGVKFGAKWQQERMYSEEEVKNLFRKYQYDLAQWILRMEDDINSRPIPTEWFEQYKKK